MKTAYKLVSAALAVAIIFIMIFVPIVYIGAQSVAAQLLVYFGQTKDNDIANEIVENNGGEVPDRVGLDFSVADLFGEDADLIKDLIANSDSDKSEAVKEQLQRFISPGVTFIICFVLLAVCAVLTVIFAFAAKDNRKVIFSSMAGIGMSFMVKYSFETIAEPFLNGKITISSLIQSFWGAFIGDIDVFKLDKGFWFIPVIFGVIILWTLFYNYTLPEKEKAQRRAMLGEEIVEVKK